MTKETYHLVPQGDAWAVISSLGGELKLERANKADAIREALAMAMETGAIFTLHQPEAFEKGCC